MLVRPNVAGEVSFSGHLLSFNKIHFPSNSSICPPKIQKLSYFENHETRMRLHKNEQHITVMGVSGRQIGELLEYLQPF